MSITPYPSIPICCLGLVYGQTLSYSLNLTRFFRNQQSSYFVISKKYDDDRIKLLQKVQQIIFHHFILIFSQKSFERIELLKCFVNYNKMQEQNYTLLMQSCQDQQVYLGKLLTYVFTDIHIAAHPSLRKIIESNSKGFVTAQYILTMPQISKYFQQLQLEEQNERKYFLKATISMYCPDLMWRAGKIRRVMPWRRNNLQKIKPICIEDCYNTATIAEIRHLFGQDCFISPLKYDGWINNYLVYSKSPPQQLYQTDQPFSFKIMSYSSICRDIERQSRLLNSTQIRKYNPIEYHHQIQDPESSLPPQISFQREKSSPPLVQSHRNRYLFANPPLNSHYIPNSNRQSQESLSVFNELVKKPNESLNRLLSHWLSREY